MRRAWAVRQASALLIEARQKMGPDSALFQRLWRAAQQYVEETKDGDDPADALLRPLRSGRRPAEKWEGIKVAVDPAATTRRSS